MQGMRGLSCFVVTDYSEALSGNNTVGDQDNVIIIDEKVCHAASNQREPHPVITSHGFLPGSKFGPDYFSVSNFLQLSK